MFLSQLTIQNFKGFNNPQTLNWEPGFNLLVGKNNAGKSSIIEAAEFQFTHSPHLSVQTRPDRDIPLNTPSTVDVAFTVTKQELITYLRRLNSDFVLPCPLPETGFMQGIGAATGSVHHLQNFADWLLQRDKFTFQVRRTAHPHPQGASWSLSRFPSFDSVTLPAGTALALTCGLRLDGSIEVKGVTPSGQPFLDVGVSLAEIFRSDIHIFSAERFNLGKSTIGTGKRLSKDAKNLPEVFNNLNGSPAKLDEFKKKAEAILPDIRTLTTRVLDQQNVEVAAWNVDPESGRDDLAISVGHCGTGTGQVLALLYTAIVVERPSVLIIDEPQSFLHPGATRKLIDTLREYSKHQYILSTHSTAVISASRPASITLVKKESAGVVLERLDEKQKSSQITCLAELGASLSDVFGADKILWVEGPTEALCFPKILEAFGQPPESGLEIVPLRNTGDLQGRHAEIVVDIYNRLTKGPSLVPPSVAIIFDAECHNDQKRNEIAHRSNDLAKFLPRRMFENYLLHPKAIAAVLSRLEGIQANGHDPEKVTAALETERKNKRYYCNDELPKEADRWPVQINGYEILKTLFSVFSEKTVRYEKVEHGLMHTQEILQNDRESLAELFRFLTELA